MRDSQKSKVYKAETVFSVREDLSFVSIYECQIYADKVRASACWARYATRHPLYVEIVHWRGYSGLASYSGRTIKLGRRSMYRLLLLHELAHCGAPQGVRHGWQYCNLYLKLVCHFMGRAAWLKLRAAFKTNRVKVHPPRQQKRKIK